MSAAAADPATDGMELPAKGGKKKLLVIAVVVLLALLIGAGGAFMLLKKKAAHNDDVDGASDDAVPTAHASAGKADPAHPPTFLPLEPFVVNLADHDADRYAQIGIVLEVDNPVFAEQMKAYMPAVRNAILLILANKDSHDLLARAGKERLAAEIRREVVRPMGIELPAPRPATEKPPAVAAADEDPDAEPPRKTRGPHNPVRHVHFSNFIIQ